MRTLRRPLALILATASAAALSAADTRVADLTWEELAPLPPNAGQLRQPGVAGPFAGVHGEVLMVAGGANFPDKMPWDGGAKIWWDDIWVLEKTAGDAPRWVSDKTFKLPRPIGYGVSVSTPEGIVCAGGNDAERCYADVFLLSWDARAREVRTTPLPAMPQPLAFMAGALVGRTLYVAGGQNTMKSAVPSAAFWALDLSKRDQPAEFKWVVLPTWPGPARLVPVAAAQRTPRGEEFFLFSGRVQQAGRRSEILSDAYAFDPKTNAWRILPPIHGVAGVSVMAGTAAAMGDSEVLIFGGDRGDLFLELETHDHEIEQLRRGLVDAARSPKERATMEGRIEAHLRAKRAIYDRHPGFGREVLAYDTQHDTWRVVALAPLAPQVTTMAVRWDDELVIPSGEIRPGVRTPAMVRVKPIMK